MVSFGIIAFFQLTFIPGYGKRLKMKVNVKVFGYLRLDLGMKSIVLNIPENATAAVMLQQFTQLLGSKANNLINRNHGGYNFIFSVNAKPATIETILQQGDEIALLPPISGG